MTASWRSSTDLPEVSGPSSSSVNGPGTPAWSQMRKVSGKFTMPCPGTGKGRFRIRHCPGFTLLNEAYGYECEQGKTYHVVLRKKGGELSIAVDGTVYCRATDPDPRGPGLIGCRTYRTHLWWDNIRVTAL